MIGTTIEKGRSRLIKIAEISALAGGAVLTGIALLMVYSVVVSSLGVPMLGDPELVELAAAAAIVGFMPYCQMKRGHVAILVFTSRLSAPLKRFLDVAANTVMTVVIAVFSWRLVVGGFDAFGREQVSMFLQLPRWWGYALMAPSCMVWVVTAICVTVEVAVTDWWTSPGSPGEHPAQ